MSPAVRHYILDRASSGVAALHDADNSAGSKLAWKFFGLGKLKGKGVNVIISQVGVPTRSSTANGQTLREWRMPDYHVALLFNAQERVVKVAIESALR